jgi:hypothetical protein
MSRRKNRSWRRVAAKRAANESGCSGARRSTNLCDELRVPRWNRRHGHAEHEAAAAMMNRLLIVAVAFFALSTEAGAQVVPRPPTPVPTIAPRSGTTAGCPGGNGIHISATSGTVTDSSSGLNTVIGLNQSVDTTLVFDISRKTWTATSIAAAISLGLADETRGTYAICAGVTALLPSATLTISGARGRVHFVASLKELSDALRLGPVQ